MSMDEIIIHLFCIVADRLKEVKPHRNVNLYPSEVVTIGLLYALKGHGFCAFYRWLSRNFRHFFPALPDLTRTHHHLPLRCRIIVWAAVSAASLEVSALAARWGQGG